MAHSLQPCMVPTGSIPVYVWDSRGAPVMLSNNGSTPTVLLTPSNHSIMSMSGATPELLMALGPRQLTAFFSSGVGGKRKEPDSGVGTPLDLYNISILKPLMEIETSSLSTACRLLESS
ncbi:hypothetical protein D5086_011628 [Populus alba]|uniref:Uncharacterized protein n=1 Tax=Populus alba TaxID=43335 RepID=A0ACC4CCS2_POPAL